MYNATAVLISKSSMDLVLFRLENGRYLISGGLQTMELVGESSYNVYEKTKYPELFKMFVRNHNSNVKKALSNGHVDSVLKDYIESSLISTKLSWNPGKSKVYFAYTFITPEMGSEGYGGYRNYDICRGDTPYEIIQDWCAKHDIEYIEENIFFNDCDDKFIYHDYFDTFFIKLPDDSRDIYEPKTITIGYK